MKCLMEMNKEETIESFYKDIIETHLHLELLNFKINDKRRPFRRFNYNSSHYVKNIKV